MKFTIFLVVGGISLLCVTGYLAYVDFAKNVFTFFNNPQHYRLNKATPQKELRFKTRIKAGFNNRTVEDKLRDKVLFTFNSVRRVIASGRIDALLAFLKYLGVNFKELSLGPAADMMELEWNTTMEDIVRKKYNVSLKTKLESIVTNLDFPGYHAFRWEGGLTETLKKLRIPSKFFEKILAKGEIAETLVCLLSLTIDYPGSLDITGKDLNAAHALVSQRNQIGCWSNKIFSICLVENDNATVLFKKGVTCTECKEGAMCEMRVQPDKSIMEGDLCVPDPNYVPPTNDTLSADNSTLIDSYRPAEFSFPSILIIVYVILYR